jgi:uncharacterized RDD family membrane protein YckC
MPRRKNLWGIKENQINTPSVIKRFAAAIYDCLLLLAVLLVASLLFLVIFGDATLPPKRHYFQAFILLCCATYFVGFWMHGGQTLAMRTWRFRLVSSSGHLTLQQALIRFALSPIGLALFIWAWVDKEKCFLHDRLAGTRLVSC